MALADSWTGERKVGLKFKPVELQTIVCLRFGDDCYTIEPALGNLRQILPCRVLMILAMLILLSTLFQFCYFIL